MADVMEAAAWADASGRTPGGQVREQEERPPLQSPPLRKALADRRQMRQRERQEAQSANCRQWCPVTVTTPLVRLHLWLLLAPPDARLVNYWLLPSETCRVTIALSVPGTASQRGTGTVWALLHDDPCRPLDLPQPSALLPSLDP